MVKYSFYYYWDLFCLQVKSSGSCFLKKYTLYKIAFRCSRCYFLLLKVHPKKEPIIFFFDFLFDKTKRKPKHINRSLYTLLQSHLYIFDGTFLQFIDVNELFAIDKLTK